jgi:3-phenylpropionate/trans-cinnamate dioxygenase ferredoxin reductase subunit
MLPNTEAAHAAGLASEHGILVDASSATCDADIVAAGDCTVQRLAMYADRLVRLESVPNALEQARSAAWLLCGKPKPNHTVPWFWSDQYDLKLQLAGLSQGYDSTIVRGDPALRSFCVFYLRGDRLLAADAVNKPMDFMLVRKALAKPMPVDLATLGDESIPLKEALSL